MASREYTVFVKRVELDAKIVDGTPEHWVARVDGVELYAPTEEALRKTLADHLKEQTGKYCKKDASSFDARMRRVWQVRIVEKVTLDEDEFTFDLFE